MHTASPEAGVFGVPLFGVLDPEKTRMLDRTLSELVREGANTIVLDLGSLEAVDSGLVRTVKRVHTRIGWRNGRLAIVGARGAIARDLRLAGLDELLVGPTEA